MNFKTDPSKTITSALCLLSALLAAVSCSSQKEEESSLSGVSVDDSLASGDDLLLGLGAKFDDDNAIFDDFSGGVDPSLWTIGDGAWGSGNGGVVPGNVSYTDDGVLILRGNGLYYSGSDISGVGTLKDGRNTGAALISKFRTRPGRYQIKMTVLPRLGSCTAFWTYANRSTESGINDNHEIDIELPGGKSTSVISFKNVLNTNYVTAQYNISEDVDVSSLREDSPASLNDGQFHVFGFDWYTDPEVIVYYVDGVVTAVNREFVPNMETRLWVGNWFPNNAGFVGQSNFETDYMYVDWIQYRPFLDQPYEAHDAAVTVSGASLSDYPSSPVSYPVVDKIANGDFEYLSSHSEDGYGWRYSTIGEAEGESDYSRGGDYGQNGSYGAEISGLGYLEQNIDSVYDEFRHSLSFQAKGKGGYAEVAFLGSYASNEIETVRIDLDSDEWKTYSKELTAPEGTYSMRLRFFASNHLSDIDNVSLVREAN